MTRTSPVRSDTEASDATTIFALSSAPGRAGVAVVRVSGPGASRSIEALCGAVPAARRAELRTLRHPVSGLVIDTGLVIFFPGPASFTGEDIAEFQVHGGRAVLQAMFDVLACLPGLVPAEAGDFARRAFYNGKLDLTQAEGLADLIDAQTEAQRVQALRQSGGVLSRLYEGWRGELIEASALVEAALDFSDEADVAEDAILKAREMASGLLAKLREHLADGHRGEVLREGFRAVLVGPPNAGKSSLMNVLAKRQVAIVSEEAGTTRDVIEVQLDLGGYPVVLSDTAGLRDAASAVEAEGIRRTRQMIEAAQLVISVTAPDTDDQSEWVSLPETQVPGGARLLRLRNKADIAPTHGGGDGVIGVSARTGDGIDRLLRAILEVVRDQLGSADAPALTQARHRALVGEAVRHLEAFETGDFEMAELRAEDLRQAATALSKLTGRIDVEDILDKVFGRFCIGK